MKTELKTPVKGTSWPSLIEQIPVGAEEPFPLDKSSSIKPTISYTLKIKHPDKQWKTRKGEHKGETVLFVRREK